MNYLHSPLGQQVKGTKVKFTIKGNACNVVLLDDVNYQRYRRGKKYSYYGGHTTQSPVILTIPESKVWHGVVDFGGYKGKADVSVTIIG
jgi:hypothetical protein